METAAAWDRIGLREHNGINLPLFSIYSKTSCGIGEFTDLIPLIYWCKELSFDVIQLLPLNDTGQDSSPYSAISAFALNPIHLGLSSLPFVQSEPLLQKLLPPMQELNKLKRCNYPAVRALKEEFLQKYYEIRGASTLNTDDYIEFERENPWLESFALFKTLRNLKGFASFEQFPIEWQNPTPQNFHDLINQHRKEINYHIFIQYLCFRQFENVKKIANEAHIFLMGDIPILINRDSADVWIKRNLFDLNYSAGAPPDVYSFEGQNWGFPTYNWQELEREEFIWWRQRLKVASKLYDIYRIDHIIGFFRIWSIVHGKSAREGKYVPEDEKEGIIQGEKILKMMIESSTMLPIGEDLGNVPNSVRDCMRRLGIAGTKVLRWERVWNEDKRFIPIKDYPLFSLSTISTHDSETCAQWWQEKKEESMDYAKSKGFDYQDVITKEQQLAALKESLHTASLFHINLLQEYLCLIKGFTSDNISEERINFPGTVSDLNWTYRFQKPVEEIVSDQALKTIIRELLAK